jgi:hypothetical protein
MRKRCVVAIAALVAAVPVGLASAAPVTDPGTGLSVDPPAGYQASPERRRDRRTAALRVSRSGDPFVGCMIKFEADTHDGALPADFKETWTSPDSAKRFHDLLAQTEKVIAFKTVEISGVRGFLMEIEPKLGRVKASSVEPDEKGMLQVLRTPRGITSAGCVTKAKFYSARRKDFEAILATVAAPR